MKLYHGSTSIIDEPVILQSSRAVDFGTGFYCTSDYGQAKRWANQKFNRLEKSVQIDFAPIVNEYEFSDTALNNYKILKFEETNKTWLDFVSEHRLFLKNENNYDLIIGPVANDTTMRVIDVYMNSRRERIDFEVAIRDLMPEKLKDQFTFKNNNIIKQTLKFIRGAII
jgi:hypothetical protein